MAPADSGLTVSVNPARIATADGTSDVTVIARQADGSAVNEGTEINLSTNLGRIDPTVAFTDTRGVASAILSGDGRIGTATVEATSGAAALATIDVQIGSQPISIGLQANPPRIPKEGGSTTLVANVLDDLTNPLPNIAIRFSTEAGSLDSRGGSIQTDANGDAVDVLSLSAFDIAGVEEGFFLVTVETVGSGELGALTTDFEIEVGGFVTSVTLTSSPGTVSLSGGDFLLTAVVLDDSGQQVEGAGVIFSSDVGTLASQGRQVFTDFDGVATDTLIVGPTDLEAFTGSVINVNAAAIGLGGLEVLGADQILISNSIGILTLQATPLTITSDVTSTISLTATLFDEAGIPVPGAGVTFFQTSTCLVNPVCSAGDLSNPGLVITDANGQAFNSLTISAAQIEDSTTMTQDVSSLIVTAETLLLGAPLSDTQTITVVPP